MFDYLKLINQEVMHLRENITLVVINASSSSNIENVDISFSDGRTFSLYRTLINHIIRFINEDIQKELEEEINNHNEHKNNLINQQIINTRNAIENNRHEVVASSSKRKTRHSSIEVRINKKNAAYKANYCDGGEAGWFKGPCSLECRKLNCSRTGKTFCRTNSICKRVLDGLSSEEEVQEAFEHNYLCYESRMLIDYRIYAGRNDDGSVRGWSLDKDRLVVLTTVKPNMKEVDRVIFGVFLVEKSYDKGVDEAFATSYPDCRIALTKEEAEEMKYWDYKTGNKGDRPIQWTEGLERFLTDEECATLLRDIVKVIEKRNDIEQTNYAKAFLKRFLNLIHMDENDIPEKAGARIIL